MPAGRPSYKPTDKERSMVSLMAAAGILHERIAASLSIDENTLRKHFAQQLREGIDNVTTLAVGTLVQQMKAGNIGAACFWLKCRAGWRETDRQEHRFVDANGKDRPMLGLDAVQAYMNSVPDAASE